MTDHGLPTRPCNGKHCNAQIIWGRLEGDTKKRIPLDPRPAVYVVKGMTDPGNPVIARLKNAFVGHHATCVDVRDFSASRPAGEQRPAGDLGYADRFAAAWSRTMRVALQLQQAGAMESVTSLERRRLMGELASKTPVPWDALAMLMEEQAAELGIQLVQR